MTKAIINRWDGGLAQDSRSHTLNEGNEILNFDIMSNPFYLTPYRDNIAETVDSGSANDYELNSVLSAPFSGTSYYICFGRNSSVSTTIKIFYKSISDATATWVSAGTGTGTLINGSGIVYKNYPYALTTNGSDTLLIKATNNATLSTAGTITGYTGAIKPFIHPEDNTMYIVAGTSISKWDGTTLTTYTSILPIGFSPVALTNYGGYLVIAGNLNGKSIAYLWGRDGTINTLQGVIDFGDGILLTIENIDEILFAVTTQASTLQVNYKLEIKSWFGSSVETIKSLSLSSSISGQNIHKFKKNNSLYFVVPNSKTIHKFSKNKSGNYVLTTDRFIYDGTSISTINGINFIGDWLWVGFTDSNGNKYLYRTENSDGFLRTSIYKTNINPNMPIEDRYEDKQLDGIYIAYTGASSGTLVVKYSVDGSSMTTIISESNSTGEKIKYANAENNGKPFLTGREFQFQIESTGGAKIKELGYYYTKIKHSN